ncbi:MAG: hypothetical protein CMI24_08610 [Opitutae bacterium]|jgi:rubredoxin|nr:hypothetical protein [Opitutae bacterium]MEC8419734.1 hypothetical protein [Verrucomicrobiota bacterium]
MNLVSLVWFLLSCPFLFLFLLRLGNSNGHVECPFCGTKKKRDEMNCKKCGFEFLEPPPGPFPWILAGGALLSILSLVAWIESQQYL